MYIPDTTVWVRQLKYSYNEPIALQYNWFPAFNNYPVVGVNYHQARCFLRLAYKLWKSERERGKTCISKVRLQTSFRNSSGSGLHAVVVLKLHTHGVVLTIVNKKGCYLANFKPQRGNYAADGGLYTVPVDRYWPNDYGLYNMAGNVAEWTSSYILMVLLIKLVSDINPEVSPMRSRRKRSAVDEA